MRDSKEDIKIPDELPIIPLRDMIIFPNLVVPLFVGRDRSVNALETAMKEEHVVGLLTQRDPEIQEPEPEDLYPVGTISVIMQELKIPDGTAKALVEGITRFEIVEFIQTEPYFIAKIRTLEEKEDGSLEIEALMRTLAGQFERAASLGKPIPQEVLLAAENIQEPGRLADFVAFHLSLKTDEKQQVLEAIEPKERLERVSAFLSRELEILEIGSRIQSRVREQLSKTQKEYFLREQMKAIQQELGVMDDQAAEVEELREKISAARMPKEVEEKALKELDRFAKMPSAAAEVSVIRTYLDWLISLPWAKKSREKVDLKQAALILDEDHYGLVQVKQRVLEYLAVHKLTKKLRGPILCFAGPPGVGKTSIGRSIAKSLGREFVRISLGGVHDEAEIRGHRRTYVGALPGRIIQALGQVKVRNPVFMMDEIDKVGADFRGDPTAALLEVLDPEQNNTFRDHYLEVPFDLSDVIFITTANLLDTIPPALRDRMEVLHFSGYTEEEKIEIAKAHLIPKQLKAHGLSTRRLAIEEGALRMVIREHTREAGVRELERKIASICRQVAKKVVEGERKKVKLIPDEVPNYLGPRRYSFGLAGKKDEVGTATGLAWTESGGDVLAVEAEILPGRGGLTLTGHLGEVMKESAQAAVSYVRKRAGSFGADEGFFNDHEVHIHVPSGAIPKDGPSAGITMASALVSILTGNPVKKTVGMTGEITIRGHVLPIGGVKEKALAAHRAGLKEIIMPKENERDLEEVPDEVKKELTFHFVDHIDEVLPIAMEAAPKDGKVALAGK
ncbi:MAG: endopeptidase La [Candidatus Aquicultorales bacterium]